MSYIFPMFSAEQHQRPRAIFASSQGRKRKASVKPLLPRKRKARWFPPYRRRANVEVSVPDPLHSSASARRRHGDHLCFDGGADKQMASTSTVVFAATAPPLLPRGWVRLDAVETQFDEGTSDVTRRLAMGIIHRTLTSAAEVTQLIQQGANPDVQLLLTRGPYQGPSRTGYPLLALSIDDMTDHTLGAIEALRSAQQWSPVAMPRWLSTDLQDAVMNALIDGGADMNAADILSQHRPLQVAVAAGNQAALGLLMARNVQLRGFMIMQLPFEAEVTFRPTPALESQLLCIYRRLIQHDSTLADEGNGWGSFDHVMRSAAIRGREYSPAFLDSYLDLLVGNGANIMAADGDGQTAFHWAAFAGAHRVIHWMSRHVSAGEINRRTNQGADGYTALDGAASQLDWFTEWVRRADFVSEEEEENIRRRIPVQKTCILVLLRGGAAPSIAHLPTATEADRRRRQLVLTEYATVLNELRDVVMEAINTALAPQRDYSMLLTRLLPLAPHHDGHATHPSPSNLSFGPQEAEAIAWHVESFLYQPLTAMATIDEYLIGDSVLRQHVRAAVAQFVRQAATRTASNREVVGGTRQEGGQTVRVPPLQCFAIGSGNGARAVRMVGVREVVHRARLDEADQHGVAGVIKGFNEHLGDGDCQFQWQQLGYMTRGVFVSLGFT
ncbi:unnamed protein product [Vitrella brassicaformis CCMP3155]|uniref:Uncharacterized protein n=2 Tax=Vitrella brassicaformis TaxID=1169539 RepID=A0A0G4F606_VITBC|nr:unnamed protein product [Vitrella brassicaformis CCMP3155]|eukprot:CEM07807.1 unnamed protein product [Vitrella brassicaformis CCMP3155]